MSLDKVLHRIQVQIKDLAPKLELFIEHTIQPNVNECEALQKQMNELNETLSVYKYLRQNKELSPSFNLHAKVSEKEMPPVQAPEPAAELKVQETAPIQTELKEVIVESIKSEPPAVSKTIALSINDKFRFINELFAQNSSEYNIAIEQLNSLRSWHDADVYLNSLKNLYDWKEQSEIVKHFYAVVKKRFD